MSCKLHPFLPNGVHFELIESVFIQQSPTSVLEMSAVYRSGQGTVALFASFTTLGL